MIKEELMKNKEFVQREFAKLFNAYRNKHVLVHDQIVVGSYDTYEAAANAGIVLFGLNVGFLVQYLTEREPVNYIAAAGI
jgi:hypothetical protein